MTLPGVLGPDYWAEFAKNMSEIGARAQANGAKAQENGRKAHEQAMREQDGAFSRASLIPAPVPVPVPAPRPVPTVAPAPVPTADDSQPTPNPSAAPSATPSIQPTPTSAQESSTPPKPFDAGSSAGGVVIPANNTTVVPSPNGWGTPTPMVPGGGNPEAQHGLAEKNPSGNTRDSSNNLGTGGIIGVVGGAIAVVLIVGAFVTRLRRSSDASTSAKGAKEFDTTTQHHTGAPDSAFGTLDSTRNNGDVLAARSDPGLWEDPAIVAARIPLEKVLVGALVSRGGFGQVHRGMYKGESVAIKTLLPESRKDLKQINALLTEVKIMAALEHERIVAFRGVAWDSLSDLSVVSEYMDGGDLRALLKHYAATQARPQGLDADKVEIALHVAHGLMYLHSLAPTLVHRDLKSRNILLDKDLNAKLTDFGISRERTDNTMTAGVGTSLWMAPEVMMGDHYDEKADIFSFGVVLSELDTHELPYAHVNESQSGRKLPETAILQQVAMGALRVEWHHERVHPQLRELGAACVDLNPSCRPTAGECLYKLQLVLQELRPRETEFSI